MVMRTALAIVVLSALLSAPLASAQAPKILNFQGRLEDNGAPVTGTTTADLGLYTVDTGGSPVWTEVGDTIVFDDTGVFAVDLGDETTLPTNIFAQPLYLGIKIAGGAELSPRLPLRAAPTAIQAIHVGTLPTVTPVPLITIPALSGTEGSGTEGVTVTPTSRVQFITKATTTEAVCVGRIEPWAGIQEGDRVMFIFGDPDGAIPQSHGGNFRFVTAGYMANQTDCQNVSAAQRNCPAAGCNLRMFQNDPTSGQETMNTAFAAREFIYLRGLFYVTRD